MSIDSPSPMIGYLGVDTLNNATICNEAEGLSAAGVNLDIVSVYRVERPTYYRSGSLGTWADRVHTLYPLRFLATACDLLIAPFMFGRRFWTTIGRAFTTEAEGSRERFKILAHLVPAITLALYWRRKPIRHIHAHWAHTATTIAMHAAELLGITFSFTGHANDLFVHRVGLVGKLRRARFVVCISEYHRRFYLGLGADPAKLCVVYCGIDLDRFSEGRDEGPYLRSPIVLGIGRLVEKKGFHDLIAACSLLKERGVGFSCTIAGSGPEEPRLRAQIAAEGLGEFVELTGHPVGQEDLPKLLHSARVVALPCVRDRDGDMDGLPQVLIEAMASGVPVVSTRLVGIPDLVRCGIHGSLVEPGDITALADALEALLGDTRLAEAQGQEAARWAGAHFGRAETTRRLAGLFDWASRGAVGRPPSSCVLPAPGSEAEYEPRATETRSIEMSERRAGMAGAR